MGSKRTPGTPEQAALVASFTNPDLDEVDRHIQFGNQFSWGRQEMPPMSTTGSHPAGEPPSTGPQVDNAPPPGTRSVNETTVGKTRRAAAGKAQTQPIVVTGYAEGTTRKVAQGQVDGIDDPVRTILLRVCTKPASVISFNQLVTQVAVRAKLSSTKIRGDILTALIDYAIRTPGVIDDLAGTLKKTGKRS